LASVRRFCNLIGRPAVPWMLPRNAKAVPSTYNGIPAENRL